MTLFKSFYRNWLHELIRHNDSFRLQEAVEGVFVVDMVDGGLFFEKIQKVRKQERKKRDGWGKKMHRCRKWHRVSLTKGTLTIF